MIDIPAGCTLVTEPYWPCEDIWPPGTLYKAAIMAYKLMDTRGLIEIERVFYNKQTDVARFRYWSLEPDREPLRRQFEQAVDDACEMLRAEYESKNPDRQKGVD